MFKILTTLILSLFIASCAATNHNLNTNGKEALLQKNQTIGIAGVTSQKALNDNSDRLILAAAMHAKFPTATILAPNALHKALGNKTYRQLMLRYRQYSSVDPVTTKHLSDSNARFWAFANVLQNKTANFKRGNKLYATRTISLAITIFDTKTGRAVWTDTTTKRLTAISATREKPHMPSTHSVLIDAFSKALNNLQA